jgi:hypothetical protein
LKIRLIQLNANICNNSEKPYKLADLEGRKKHFEFYEYEESIDFREVSEAGSCDYLYCLLMEYYD